MTKAAVSAVDSGARKAPRAFEIFGQPARNATGSTATPQSLAARFG